MPLMSANDFRVLFSFFFPPSGLHASALQNSLPILRRPFRGKKREGGHLEDQEKKQAKVAAKSEWLSSEPMEQGKALWLQSWRTREPWTTGSKETHEQADIGVVPLEEQCYATKR